MKACLVTNAPHRDESLLGYLRRIGAAQAYRETSDFLTSLGFRYGRPLVESLPEIASFLNISVEQLNSVAPAANANRPALDWNFERHHRDPICPECLAQGSFFHQGWRHALVSACHAHHLRLQDSCPACQEALLPNSGGFEHCSCGFPLKDFPREEAGSHEVTVARLISGCSGGECRNVPSTLATAPPASAGKFVHFLASGFTTNRTGKEGKTAIPITVADTVAFLKPVAPLLNDWPKGFSEHVEGRLAHAKGEANSAPAALGNWYQRLMKFREPAYRPYHDAVAQVVESCFEGSYAGALASAEQRTWLPAKQAAAKIGISPQRLAAAVQKKEIQGNLSRSGFGHEHTVVSTAQVRKIASDRDRYWDGRKARGILGVTRRQFDLLKEMALIEETPAVDRPPLTDGGFDSLRLESLLANIRRHAVSRAGQTIAFSEITLRRTTDRAALQHVFERIFSGQISALKATVDMRLGEFLFQRSEVEAELSRGRFSRDWTAHDVAKLTGWKSQSVVHWCRLGLLEAREREHGPNVAYLISPEQLAKFQSEFVPVATIAKAGRTSSRKLLSQLEKRGIATHGSQRECATTRGHLLRIADVAFLHLN